MVRSNERKKAERAKKKAEKEAAKLAKEAAANLEQAELSDPSEVEELEAMTEAITEEAVAAAKEREAVEAAAKEKESAKEKEKEQQSSKKRKRKAGEDGEWLPPLLQREKNHRDNRKKQSKANKEAKTAAAAAPVPPPVYPPIPYPYYGYYPRPPYYPYPYPYAGGQAYSGQAWGQQPAAAPGATPAAKEKEKPASTEHQEEKEEKVDDNAAPEEGTDNAKNKKTSEEEEEKSQEETEKQDKPEPKDAAPANQKQPYYSKHGFPIQQKKTLPRAAPPPPPQPPLVAVAPHPVAYAHGLAHAKIVANPYARYPPNTEVVGHSKKSAVDEELPPFLQGLKVMYPKKAEMTIDAIRKTEGGALQYDQSNYHAMHQNGIRNMAEHLDYILYTGARGNPRNAAYILQSLLRRPNLESVKEHMEARHVQSKEAREQARKEQKQLQSAEVDKMIVQGVKDFLHSHRTSSLRRTQEYHAVQAVMTAACSAGKVMYGRRDKKKLQKSSSSTNENGEQPSDEEEEEGEKQPQDRRGKTGTNPRWGITQDTYNTEQFPCEKIAKRLNRSVEEVTTFRNEMAGKPFVPRKQKTQEDYYKENPAGACVLEFCHSVESSWPASKNENATSAFRPVKNPITGEREEHRVRVWHEEAPEERYRDFAQSVAYRKFLSRQRNDPTVHSISFELFCASMCPCCLDQHPKGKDRKRKKPDLPLAMAQQQQDLPDEEPEPALYRYNRW